METLNASNEDHGGAEKPADDIQKPKSDWFDRMNIGGSAGPSQRKPKKIREDDEEEDTELSEKAKLAIAARDEEIDDILRINRELEEAAETDAALLLESRKLHFPRWDFQRMRKDAITEPIENWLQPICSYDTSNQVDSQFDFPITARVFLIRAPDHQILAEHVKKLLMGYVLEILKLDIEVAALLNSTPKYKPEKPTSDLKRRRFGKIYLEEWNVTPLRKEMIQLKGCDKKSFNDMLTWYMTFRKRILLLIPRVCERELKVPKPEVDE
ncbi:hypothetical protein L2E82_50084 [Cichorium intybus]|nr:hypothetical protein L2E82_50084 [Cichorium intybus]